jgi:hypothetical protein
MTIPYPDNPQHVDNLTTIPLLEFQGWEGSDASLEESIFFYDFAWRILPEPNEDGDDTLFLYRIAGRKPRAFDRCSMSSKLDFAKEFNWIKAEDWQSFFDTYGTVREAWEEQAFVMKIYDLFNYWGCENIFGSSYWEGFAIEDPQQASDVGA